MRTLTLGLIIATAAATTVVAAAAELQSRTIAAFDRYVAATERRLTTAEFLWVDGLREPRRAEVASLMRRGELSIDRVETREGDRVLEAPGGMVHHWVGTTFIPGATIDQALKLLQNYDSHERIYAPNVARSRLIAGDGDRFRFFLRFTMKKIITVVVNSDHEAIFTRRGADRAEGWIRSTRIAEVEDAGEPGEREKPVGQDGGYLWRLNTYWRLAARDGGLYIQCESISLTRGIPAGFGWLIRPFVTSIPRETLTFTLETTRKSLAGPS